MTIEQIKERIAKAQSNIKKRENTIEKKKDLIKKKYLKIKLCGVENPKEKSKVDFAGGVNHEVFWLYADIEHLNEDIETGLKKIKDIQSTIAKYQDQLNKAQIKEHKLTSIPQVLVDYKEHLIKVWDEYDLNRQQVLKKEYKEIGYSEFIQKYTYQSYNFIQLSDKEIHKDNVKSAEALILNLLQRTEEIVGVITDCQSLYIDSDNLGYSVINGIIHGTKGSCIVESIGAGGYNIQKWHVRVLVKPVK